MFSLVLLSGGKGTRMQRSLPKQYLLLGGKPIIMHTLERIDNMQEISDIIIVCETEYTNNLMMMAEQYNIKSRISYVVAGNSRQESVYNGLLHCKNDQVVIHEAVRPFVKTDDFMRLLEAEEENAILGYTINYTVLKGRSYIESELNREELVNVQLPQKFNLALLRLAHERARDDKKAYTEDSHMVFHYFGTQIRIVNGMCYNIKITEPIDLSYGEVIYKKFFSIGG